MINYPAIRILILYVIGIISGKYFNFSSEIILLVLSFSLLILLFQKYLKKEIINFLLILSIINIGFLSFNFNQPPKVEYPFQAYQIKNIEIEGTLTELLLPNKKNQIAVLKAENIFFNNSKIESGLSISILIPKNEIKKYKIGDYLRIKGKLTKFKNDRNPGEFDFESLMLSRGISGVIYPDKINIVRNHIDFIDKIKNIIISIRYSIDEVASEKLSSEAASFVRGFILADRSLIDDEIEEDFVNTGTIHVLAVSGLHVGLIALMLNFLFKRAGFYWKNILTIVGLILFLLITLWPVSVSRAVLMVAIYIISTMISRDKNNFNVLALAAFIILIISPQQLFEIGFQLSFSAVLSIFVFYPYFDKKINSKIYNKPIKLFTSVFILTISATLGTLPLTVFYFQKFSIISFFVNIFVVPFIEVLLILIFMFYLSLIFGAFINTIFILILNYAVVVLVWFVSVFGNLSFAFIDLYNIKIYDILFFYCLFFVGWFANKQYKNKIFKTVSFALLIMIYATIRVNINTKLLNEDNLNVISIDVGQGDSFLILFDNNETALIDAGAKTKFYDAGEKTIIPLLNRFGISKIDYAFISHMDNDHYGGFETLIQNDYIKQIWKPHTDTLNKNDLMFEKLCYVKNVKIHNYRNEQLQIGNARIITLKIEEEYNKKNINNIGGIIKLVYGKNSILFTADIDKLTEKQSLESYGDLLKTDILKIAHHGSKTSSSPVFLEYIKPERALISVGLNNIFRHPSPIVIDRINHRKIKIDRTDKEGAVIYSFDGVSINKIDWRK